MNLGIREAPISTRTVDSCASSSEILCCMLSSILYLRSIQPGT